MHIELSIVMPCLNESKTLGACIAKAQNFMREQGIAGEVVVGDNGSVDGSIEIARSHGARVINVKQRGYGAALLEAIRNSKGNYIIMGDSDDSYNFLESKVFYEKLREGADIVMGNRFRGGIEPGAMPWKNRYIGNPVLTWLGRLFFHVPCGDFHCGMRAFTRQAFDRLNLSSLGMEFASEMVIKAQLNKMKIEEIPIKLYKDGRDRPPHLKPWRDGWRHLLFMLIHSPRWLFLYPGLALMFVGTALGCLILEGTLFVGEVGFDIGTLLLCSALVIIGFQAVFFSLFSRIYSASIGILPATNWVNKFVTGYKVERGIVLGLCLVFTGALSVAYGAYQWSKTGFSSMDPHNLFRVLIPAFLFLILGAQVFFSSMYLEVLQVGRRSRSNLGHG